MKTTAYYKKDGESTEDRALETFTNLMIEKIEQVSKDWKKPWFTEGESGWPESIRGREYDGLNAFMLMLLCEKHNYKVPVFLTISYCRQLNAAAKDKPAILVNKGEKSFPVMFYKMICKNEKTGQKIETEDYQKLSDAEKKDYKTFPVLQCYPVFNVAQTNMETARPDLWEKVSVRSGVAKPEISEDKMTFPAVDKIIDENLWICPIKPKHQDRAFFSLTLNEITVPEKSQFKDGENFYGTLFHEMTHSTGIDGQLNRIKPATFGSNDYAREELVAELGSALVAQKYGIEKKLEEDNAKYLKCWLSRLKESPKYIKTIMADVKKAAGMITKTVDGVITTCPAA